MTTLEELAEYYCLSGECEGTYTMTLADLRLLIEKAVEIVQGGIVCWECENAFFDTEESAQDWCDHKAYIAEKTTPLHHIDMNRLL